MKRLHPSIIALLALVATSHAQAELVLRQSTASQAVMIGPFVDSTDGNTAETALTIDAADVRISVNGANIVGKTSGGCTHDELGYYTCTFDATDTATVGRMQVMVHETGALPVYHEFQIAAEAVYDACCAASAAPLTASDIWSNGTRTLTAATNITSTGGTITVSSGAVTAGTVSDKTGYALSSTGLNTTGWPSAWDAEVESEVADALAALSITEPAAKPTWGSSTLAEWIAWIGAWSRNEVQQTSTTKTLRNDADSGNLVTCAVSDDGTTFQLSECSP